MLWESSSPPETCPHLVESIPCEDPVCYLWQVQQEETCIPTKSSCGPGTAAQNVTCVSAEGTVLDINRMHQNQTLTHAWEFVLVVQCAYLSAFRRNIFNILGNMLTCLPSKSKMRRLIASFIGAGRHVLVFFPSELF